MKNDKQNIVCLPSVIGDDKMLDKKKGNGKMSTLLKWAQNTTQSKSKQALNNGTNGTNGKSWIHPPDALQKGHIAYLVKFMGNTAVDQPKGIEVVKEGIRKLQFSAQLKKAETGAKSSRKVELTISVDGVAIQEPKSHTILHQFPLHRISYCADDKGEKRFFSFIAKQPNPDTTSSEDKHECFVFVSDKLAEEITLTIGQAFELAYKRFLDTSGKDLEAQRRAILSQQRIKRLEQENNIYKQRLLEISHFTAIKPELDSYLRKHSIKNILELPAMPSGGSISSSAGTGSPEYSEMSPGTDSTQSNGKTTATERLLDISGSSSDSTITNGNAAVPPVPPRRIIDLMGIDSPPVPVVGTRLEGLLLNEFESDQDFDPRSFENGTTNGSSVANHTTNGSTTSPPLLAPPPKVSKRHTPTNNGGTPTTFGQDLFGSTPFHSITTATSDPFSQPKMTHSPDPFEMGDFNNTESQQDLENAIGMLDKRILEMKDGFSRGLSFGNDDFSLESLDPLKN